MERLLIKKVRENKFLYDDQQKFYRDTEKRLETWDKIGNCLNMRGDEARCAWDKLRRCYINARNRRCVKEHKSGQPLHPWKYETEMAFLLPFAQKKRKILDTSKFEESNENCDSVSQHNLEEHSFNGCNESLEFESADRIKSEVNVQTEPEVLCYIQSEHELHHDDNEDHNQSYPTNRKRNYSQYDHDKNDDDDDDGEGDDDDQTEIKNPKKKLVRQANSILEMDEDDMFFMSMAQMTKSLPTILDRAKVKLAVSNAVLQALINANLVPSPVAEKQNGETMDPIPNTV